MCQFLKLIWVLMLVLVACSTPNKNGANRTGISFYYWKTEFNPGKTEQSWLNETQCKRLYVRFFDLDEQWDRTYNYQAAPVARLKNKQKFPENMEVVPVIYITQGVIREMDNTADLEKYVDLCIGKINRMAHRNGCKKVKEYQLDCDWTDESRNPYFAFVKKFKEKVSPAIVSVTLRLYQYKYRTKAGVPPADRVMLMYYNMGDIGSSNNGSYILNNTVGSKYVTGVQKYPLPVDFALPLYYQGRKFNKEENLFYGFLSPEELRTIERSPYMQKKCGRKWKVHPVHGNNYRSRTNEIFDYLGGAEVVISDKFEIDELEVAMEILEPCINTKNYHVAFYHLDSVFLSEFNAYEINNLLGCAN